MLIFILILKQTQLVIVVEINIETMKKCFVKFRLFCEKKLHLKKRRISYLEFFFKYVIKKKYQIKFIKIEMMLSEGEVLN